MEKRAEKKKIMVPRHDRTEYAVPSIMHDFWKMCSPRHQIYSVLHRTVSITRSVSLIRLKHADERRLTPTLLKRSGDNKSGFRPVA